MKVLVTGAAGFIANHLINQLLDQKHTVVGIDNFISGSRDNIEQLSSRENFHFVEGDVLELFSALESIGQIDGYDEIYHIACPASPPIYQRDQLNTLDVCFTGSRNALSLGEKNNAKVFLASTSECYGDPEVHPQPETYRGNVNTFGPRACYDEGKRAMEALAYCFGLRGTDVRIARIFNTYGPKMNPNDGRVVTNFIVQALKNEPITIYGDGTQTRSLCFATDLVDGIRRLMASEIKEPINLGSNFEFSVLEIAETVKSICGSSSKFSHKELPPDDPKLRKPDITRALKKLNWVPHTTLEDGLRLLIEDIKNKI